MLTELLWALYVAETDKERSRAYKNLFMLGMDKSTADLLVKEISDETWVSFGFNPYNTGSD